MAVASTMAMAACAVQAASAAFLAACAASSPEESRNNHESVVAAWAAAAASAAAAATSAAAVVQTLGVSTTGVVCWRQSSRRRRQQRFRRKQREASKVECREALPSGSGPAGGRPAGTAMTDDADGTERVPSLGCREAPLSSSGPAGGRPAGSGACTMNTPVDGGCSIEWLLANPCPRPRLYKFGISAVDRDAQLVVTQTQCSFAEASAALARHNGDLIEAVLACTKTAP